MKRSFQLLSIVHDLLILLYFSSSVLPSWRFYFIFSCKAKVERVSLNINNILVNPFLLCNNFLQSVIRWKWMLFPMTYFTYMVPKKVPSGELLFLQFLNSKVKELSIGRGKTVSFYIRKVPLPLSSLRKSKNEYVIPKV